MRSHHARPPPILFALPIAWGYMRPRLPIITTAQPLVQPALSQTEDSALVCTNVLCV
jgi:hypothetical protein